jgi:hypothetical protein
MLIIIIIKHHSKKEMDVSKERHERKSSQYQQAQVEWHVVESCVVLVVE